jgi:trimeric autotransporter adhesin
MGWLSIVIGIVAVVGAVFTGGSTLALLAGALALGSAVAQQGWLGGGMKNFFNSSVGKDLTLAAGIASIGSSVANIATSASSTAATADQTAATAAENSGTAANGGLNAAGVPNDLAAPAASASNVAQTGAAASNAASSAAQTPSQFLNSVLDPTNSVGSFAGTQASDATLAPGLTSAQDVQQANAASSASNTTAATTEGSTQQAAGAAASNTPPPGSPTAQAGAAANGGSGAQPTQGTPQVDPGPNPGNQPLNIQGGSAGTGMLSQVGQYIGKNPSVALMGGQALSGMAQGAMQQKSMQEQIAAEQWASQRWANPQLAAQFETAADAPVNVPGGYLQRAAAVRSMVSGAGGTAQPGSQPGAAPTSAPASTVAPVGMGSSPTGSGAVPVLGMNATPRGGVV